VGKKPYSVAGFNPPLSYTLREDAHGCADEERFALAHPAPRLAGEKLEYKSLKSKYWKSFPPLFCRGDDSRYLWCAGYFEADTKY